MRAAFVLGMVAAAAEQPWPVYRQNHNRTGVTPVTIPTKDMRLTFLAQPLSSTVEGTISTPVIATAPDGSEIVAFLDYCGTLRLYNSSGPATNMSSPAQPLWSYATGAGCGQVWSPAFSADGARLFAVVDKGVFAVDTATGALLWYHSEYPDQTFRGSPFPIDAYGLVSVPTADPQEMIYHLNMSTGSVVFITAFGEGGACLASELSLGYWLGQDYAFYTGCDELGEQNLLYRIHLDTGAADSVDGAGVTGETPPVFVDDTTSDPVHSVVYDLTDGVIAGIYVGTWDAVSVCDVGSKDFAGMALLHSPAPGINPAASPPVFVTIDPVGANVTIVSPLPETPPPNPGVPLPPCHIHASISLQYNSTSRVASLTTALATVDAQRRIFIPDQQGNVWCIDTAHNNGTQWSLAADIVYTTPTGQSVWGNIAVGAAGTMYFADYSGTLFGVRGT